MRLEIVERQQVIPATLSEAWSFFCRPDNLAAITPPWLGFQVTSPTQERMHAGMIITYTINPLLGLRVNWVTEITHCEEPSFFVDEQRVGPYRFWHHQHHFSEVPDGVEVRDIVHYLLPFGPLGSMLSAVVKRRLQEIFDYRRQAVQRRFAG